MGSLLGIMPATLIVMISIYALVLLLLAVGLWRLPRSTPVPDQRLPFVSVIVACRNEEVDLPACLAALERLDFPRDRLEILLVDDRSTDGTGRIIAEAARRHRHVRALSTTGLAEGRLRAKARGVAHAARQAKGDWLFITDADAVVHPGWIRHMLSRTDERTGLIAGMMLGKGGTLPGIIERLSWAYALPFAFGLAGWGATWLCVGPNMAVRRRPYLDAGGLEAADFRIAEDLAIFRLVFGQGYRAVAHASAETTVHMSPVPSLRHLLSQQRRWLRGGFEGPWYVGAGLVFTFGYHFIMSLLLLAGWFIAPVVTGAAWAVKWLTDTVMIGVEAHRIQARGLRRMTPLLLVFSVPAFLWLPPSLLLIPQVRWMGEGYAVNYGRPRQTAP